MRRGCAYRKSLDAAIAAFPNDVELLLKRGMAESPDPADRGAGSVSASVPFYERALKVSPNHLAGEALPRARVREQRPHEGSRRCRGAPMRRRRRAFRTRATCTGTSCAAGTHHGGDRAIRSGRQAAARLPARREKIAAELDWHHAHNLDLLAASYQYIGQMRKAEALLKQSFNAAVEPAGAGRQQARVSAFLVGADRLEKRSRPRSAARASRLRGAGHRSHRGRVRAAGDESPGRWRASNAALRGARWRKADRASP